MNLPREHEHTHAKKSPRHLAPPGESQDKRNDHEDVRHHPAIHQEPHPPHHPQHKPVLPSHQPHTQPPGNALDIDHGTHEDRPRPGKMAKKARRPVT
jgi:hypothetical protein